MNTYQSLIKEIEQQKIKAFNLQAKLNDIPGLFFIQAAESKSTFFDSNEDKINRLVDEVNQRDFPLTVDEIIEIFTATGWGYSNQNIKECNPDSFELVNSYRKGELF